MFKLSCDKLNHRRATKTIQTTNKLFEALGFNDLVEPGIKEEMYMAFHEVFKRYARITNPEDGGKKVFAFDAHCLVEYLCRVWAELCGTFATSCEELLRDKALLEEEVRKLSEAKDGRVQKLTGELDVCHKKLKTIQESYMERYNAITKLEALVAAQLIKLLNVTNPHTYIALLKIQINYVRSGWGVLGTSCRKSLFPQR